MDTKTHKKVVEIAVNYLNKDILTNNMESLIFYGAQPDFDETDGAFKHHFYNPATNKNYAGEYDSALARFAKYYLLAINNCQNNNGKYVEYIGRSIHYLVDLNTPVHTYNQDAFDAVVNVNMHVNFETECDNLVDNFSNDNIQIDNIDYFINNSIKTIGMSCALTASKSYYNLVNNKEPKIDICNKSINNAIINTIGILYRFCNEWG